MRSPSSLPRSVPARFPRPQYRRHHRLVVGLVATALAVAIPAVAATASVATTAPAAPVSARPAAVPPKFPSAAWSKAIGPTHLSSPVIADVNGDGHPDIVTADLSGRVNVIDGRTGHELPGWPQLVQPRAGSTAAVESSPTVADLDHNGRKEIIVGAGSVDIPNQQGGVVAFNANGSVRWRLQTMTVAGQNGVEGTPAVGDVNGDGFPEVVFGSFDHRIYVLNRFGQALPGFPMDSLDTIWDSPALYDEAHLGRMDIFLGGDASPGGPCGSQTWSGIMRAIRVTSGGPQVLWSRCRHQIYQSSPAIGDLDGNGRLAVVVGTGDGPSGDAAATNSLSAFYLDNGADVPGWPVLLNGPIFGSPVIGDVNGDHKNDVVVTACAICNDGRVWAINGHGQVLWAVAPGAAENNHSEILSTPILVDLDGNGVNDVAVGQVGGFYFLRGRDGARLYRPIEANRVVQDSAAVANFGPGYGWRLIVQSWVSGDGLPKDGAGRVDAFPLPHAPAVAPAWPQWRLTANHVAAPKAPPVPPAHAGYWLVASDGGIFAYGNAHFYGSTGGMHLNQPIVGMARTKAGHGYWLVASDGGMFSFGDAHFYGSMGGSHLNQPIVGMAPTPSGHGYWLVASDGGIFTFGNAHFYGSTGGMHLNQPIVGMAPTPSGHGYWLVASDGGMFTFGDAHFYGSTGGMHLNQPIVGMAPTPSGHGYWLVASDGGMFSFGDAHFYGSTGGMHLNQPITGMSRTGTGHGYWLVASDGGMFTFGDAHFYGSTGGQPLAAPITALTPTTTSHGYWLVGENGDVYPFGDAKFFGSAGGVPLNRPIVTAAASRRS